MCNSSFFLIVIVWHIPRLMVGMKELFGLFAEGLSEHFVVEFLNIWVFMTETQFHMLVKAAQHSSSGWPALDVVDMEWLTAAAGASAWTGHDFNKIIFDLPSEYGGTEFVGIGEATGNSYSDFVVADGEGGVLP